MSEAVDTLEKKSEKGGVGEFIRETRAELDRTTFPGGDEVKKTTIIVIVSVIFFALYLFLIDHVWVYVLEAFVWLVDKIVGV